MSVKDKLQIILITYNRANHVQKTFEQILFDGSPILNCEIIVQDNNSTDNTREIVEEFAKSYPNIKYTKNHYNLGISGTIARAMEVANKDYVWIIGDDDIFDFSNWSEVEKAINNNEKIICHARYVIPNEHKNNPAYQLFQLTFITGGIYHTSLFNDTTIKNAFDNIYTLFPHIPPIIQFINDGGNIYVVDKAITDNGMNLETTDCSYTRGVKNKKELYDRTNEMSWILGYSNIISLLNDKNLQKECIKTAVVYKDIYGSWENFYHCIQNQYINSGKINYFLEIYNVLPDEHKKHFDWANAFTLLDENKKITSQIEKQSIEFNLRLDFITSQLNELIIKNNKPTLLQQIFSVKNESKHKVIRIFGIRIKIRRKR